MRRALRLHPDCHRDSVSRIDAEITRGPEDILTLCYRTTGLPKLPPTTDNGQGALRTDDLWMHTCFEAFIRHPSDEPYCEFNFSPDRRWAAYQFDGYRLNRRDLAIPPPRIETQSGNDGFVLRAELQLETLAGDWQIGVSAVIEDESGRMSYWALNHPPGKPDFHHADGFALELAP